MGERLLCTQEVIGSNPIISTREWIKTLKRVLSVLIRSLTGVCTLKTEQWKMMSKIISKATEGASLKSEANSFFVEFIG